MYNFGLYSTAVDLWKGLFSNIFAVELALQSNSGAFHGLSLWDQSVNKGQTSGDTGQSYASGNGRQAPWSTTGFAELSPSSESLTRHDNNYLYHIASYVDDISLASFYDIGPELQSGSSETVRYFLNRSNGVGKPLDALILSNHGGSFAWGFNGDGPKYDNDKSEKWMQVTELADALGQENKKLGLFGFDECNMANIEAIAELYPYTHYYLASQEIVSGTGLDYYTPLSTMPTLESYDDKNIRLHSERLGIEFVKAFANLYNNDSKPNTDPEAPAGATMSLVDSARIEPLLESCEQFAIAFEKSSSAFVYTFLRELRNRGTKYFYSHLADLGQVAQLAFHNPYASEDMKLACQYLLVDLNFAVKANNRGYEPDLGNFNQGSSSGLTITMMRSLDDDSDVYDDFSSLAPEFEAATGWQSRVLDRSFSVLEKNYSSRTAEPDPLNPTFHPGSDQPYRSKKVSEKNLDVDAFYDQFVLQRQEQYNSKLFNSKDDKAVLTLRQNGLLENSSSSRQINREIFSIPDYSGKISLRDLSILLTLDGMKRPGAVKIEIADENNKVKSTVTQELDFSERVVRINGKTLADSARKESDKTLSPSDQIILKAKGKTSIVYDLGLSIKDMSLGGDPFYYKDIDSLSGKKYINRLSDSSLVNLRLKKGKPYSFRFTTPVFPGGANAASDGFFTTFELQSSSDGPVRITLVDENDVSMAFQGTQHFKFDGFLESNETYDVSIDYRGQKASSSDISLTVDQEQSSTPNWAGFYDYLKDADLRSDIRPMADASFAPDLTALKLPKPVYDFDGIADFYGKDLENRLSLVPVQSLEQSQFLNMNKPTNYMSGIWESDNKKVQFNVKNNNSFPVELGLYEVDPLTGDVQSKSGKVVPLGDTSRYHKAALHNLVDPLSDLAVGDDVSSTEFPLKKGKAYAAVLMWQEKGVRKYAYSASAANEQSKPLMAHFGNFFYGFELNSSSQEGVDFSDLLLEIDYTM